MTVFDQMLARYEIKTGGQKRNATHEVMQEMDYRNINSPCAQDETRTHTT